MMNLKNSRFVEFTKSCFFKLLHLQWLIICTAVKALKIIFKVDYFSFVVIATCFLRNLNSLLVIIVCQIWGSNHMVCYKIPSGHPYFFPTACNNGTAFHLESLCRRVPSQCNKETKVINFLHFINCLAS